MVGLKVGDVMERTKWWPKVGDVMERTKCGAEGWRRNGKSPKCGAEGWRRNGKSKVWG